MQRLLDDIDQVEGDVDDCFDALDKSFKSRDSRRIEAKQTQMKNLQALVLSLQKQLANITKEANPRWSQQAFDRAKRAASKTLVELSKRLSRAVPPEMQSPGMSPVPTADVTPRDAGATANRNRASGSAVQHSTPSLSTEDDESDDRTTDSRRDYTEDSEEESDDDSDSVHYSEREPQNKRTEVTRTVRASTPSQAAASSSTSTTEETSYTSTTASSSDRSSAPRANSPSEYTETDDDETYFEEEEEEEDEDDSVTAKLRKRHYKSGTQFRSCFDHEHVNPGDLPARRGDVLTLLEQTDDDWWIFENARTKQHGVFPINYIELHSNKLSQSFHSDHNTSSVTLVDAFNVSEDLPSGFVASELAPLAHQKQRKLTYSLIPRMTESNFAFADLHWQHDTARIAGYPSVFQKILTIEKCSKIPKVNTASVEVLNRCIRVCLHDGIQVVSNIHTSRMCLSPNAKSGSSTEDWHFLLNGKKTFIDEHSMFLIRANRADFSKELHLVIELGQFCQSKTSHKPCEVGCGWIRIPLIDAHNDPPDSHRSAKYDKRLRGGHLHEPNRPLDDHYNSLHSSGIRGQIDRRKQARIQFSLEPCEKRKVDQYNQLPLASLVVPINLVQILAFYRNELAYQLQKHSHNQRASTTPIHSIFLSTFEQALEEPDLIYILHLLYHRGKGATEREQCEDFLDVYEHAVYPLLFHARLPPYDFHDVQTTNQRRKMIITMSNKQRRRENDPPDALSLFLDPQLTSEWEPFTTDEVCFSLQNFVGLSRT